MLVERKRECPGCGQTISTWRMTCPMCGEKVYRALVEKQRKAREDPDISKGFMHRGLR
jgi:predicted amidophosphoribosyltransferase